MERMVEELLSMHHCSPASAAQSAQGQKRMHISTRIGLMLWITCLCGAPAGFANETRMPSPGQSANGDRLLAWAHRALEMKSLTRKAVEESLGLRLLFDNVNEIDHSGVQARRWRFKVAGGVPAGVLGSQVTYEVSAAFVANNGVSLVLPIDTAQDCITEAMLETGMGGNFIRTNSTPRHFTPGQKVPAGIRPTHETVVYATARGLTIGFGFDFTCASEIHIRDARGPDWRPLDEGYGLPR
jgi:hypothetical protein